MSKNTNHQNCSLLKCRFEGCDEILKKHMGSGRQPEYCIKHKWSQPLRTQIRVIPSKLLNQKQRFIVPICDDCKRPINNPTMGKTCPTKLCQECKAKRHNEREKKRYHESKVTING